MRLLPLALLLLIPGASALEWSEILFDPQGTDNGLEFIELSGNGSLEGCTVSDASSSDELTHVHNGTNGFTLIVEEDSALMNMTTEAAVYHAGAAIGNALGNTGDSITIACGNETPLTTTYEAAAITGWQAGLSIVLRDGAWAPSVENGTPGLPNPAPPPPPPPPPSPPGTVTVTFIPSPKPSGGGGGGGAYIPPVECDSTLLVTVSATTVYAGDLLSFTVLAPGPADFEIFADDVVIEWGDTAAGPDRTITVPSNASEMRIVATSDRCDAHQRAVRLVKILPGQAPAADLSSDQEMPEGSPVVMASVQDSSARPPARSVPDPTGAVVQEIAAPLASRELQEEVAEERPAPIPTRTVIADSDSRVVVWVSAFGIITMLVSVGLFLHLRRQETAVPDGTGGRKVYKPRRGPARREGQRHPQADQERMASGDRDVRDRGEAQGPRGEGPDRVPGQHPPG